MSNQEFCRYCGRDTRGEHRDDCPADELDELRERIEALEARRTPAASSLRPILDARSPSTRTFDI